MILSIVSPRVISFSPNIPDSHEVDRIPRGHTNICPLFGYRFDENQRARLRSGDRRGGRPTIGVEVKGRLSEGRF